MEVTKEDIIRIHDKMDKMATDLAEVKTTMKLNPPVKQPCKWHNELENKFDKHIENHTQKIEESQTKTKDRWMGVLFKIIEWAAIALIAFLLLLAGIKING